VDPIFMNDPLGDDKNVLINSPISYPV